MRSLKVGDAVYTALGKGVIRELQNGGRALVTVRERSVLVAVADLRPLATKPTRGTVPALTPVDAPAVRHMSIDLHGLTVDDALARLLEAIDHALRGDASELHVIHGRSGGRIKKAVHRRLASLPVVQSFRIDPRNAGVTIVTF